MATAVTHSTPERDFRTMRQEYVEGITNDDGQLVWPSLAQIAARHGVPEHAIRAASSRHDWGPERVAFQRRMDHERQEAKAVEAARLGANLDISALRLAQNGLAITSNRIAELGALAQRRTEELQRNPNATPSTRAVDSMELERLSRAGAQWYELGTRALGDAQRVRVELDVHETVEATVEVRDARSMGLLAILHDVGKVDELSEVVDVNAGRLQVAPGGDEGAVRDAPDASSEPVRAEHADDGQPEPQADSVPATG